MTRERLHLLLSKYLEETLSEEERVELSIALQQDDIAEFARDEILLSLEENRFSLENDLEHVYQNIEKDVREDLVSEQNHVPVRFLHRFRWVAAAILLLVAGATWIMLSTKDNDNTLLSQSDRFKNDVSPARTGAVLRLSDGTVINLDTAGNGELGNGFYKTADAIRIDQAKVDYATLETPFGHTMRAVLSDGTIVWLNAGSSIRFPTSFSGNIRQVRITGEAYFEVAKQSMPFIVETGKENIEVLGTHFNINTYEALHLTTLLEGSVKVGRTILQPGEQWDGKKVKQPDLNEVMAWKDGLFRFKDASIDVLMKDIARWYAVEVVFEGAATKQQFIATIPRTATVVEVLRALETTGGVHFSIEGKKVTVRP